MSVMDQVVENVRLQEIGAPASLTDEELATISKVKGRYKDMLKSIAPVVRMYALSQWCEHPHEFFHV